MLLYLYHCFTSRSPFSLHSPFVYTLYSKVLRDKKHYNEYNLLEQQFPGIKHKKYYRLLLRLTAWFKPGIICYLGKEKGAETEFLHAGFPESRIYKMNDLPEDPSDMIFIDMQELNEPLDKCFSRLQQHITNESVFIIWSIQDPLALKRTWKQIQTLPGITVTIDMFYLGLVFVNRNLSREDFRIRF